MNFREVQVEILGSFAINFLTSWARISADLKGSVDYSVIAFVHAFSTMAFIALFYPTARCHFTPLLSLTDMIFKNFEIKNCALLILSQFVGALASTALLSLTLSSAQITELAEKSTLGFAHINPVYFNSINGFWAELLLASLLAFIQLRYSGKPRGSRNWVEFYAVIRASVLLFAGLACEGMSGLALNPFPVMTGALLSTDVLQNQWVYVLAPVIGISIGGMLVHRKAVSDFLKVVT